MKRLINKVLQEWSNHPRLSGLIQGDLRERMANDIVNNMRKKSTGNGWFLDLSSDYMRKMVNPEDR
tara:strand:- start:1375 stop:1572 length:198 start_codon:yes stop_codon:yes gene_type:complete